MITEQLIDDWMCRRAKEFLLADPVHRIVLTKTDAQLKQVHQQ